MKDVIDSAAGAPLTYVLYQDGVVPENPFRPDKARKVEAWYWIVTQFPDFVIQRSACWPTATLLRTSIVQKLPSGVSYVTRKLLRIFKPLADGIVLPMGNDSVIF